MKPIRSGVALLALAAAGGAAFGQSNTQAPAATPAPATIPGLDTFKLPADRPTPAPEPQPTIASAPRPTQTPTPSATPTPRKTPAPRSSATPAVRPTATPTPEVPAATPSPVASPTPQPPRAPIEVVTPSAAPASSASFPWMWVWGGAFVLAVAILAASLFLRRKRRAETPQALAQEPVPPPRKPANKAVTTLVPRETPPAPAPAPEVPPPPPAPAAPTPLPLPVVRPVTPAATGSRARLKIELEVKRAGTNLLNAAVDYRFLVTNAGDTDAIGVAIDLRLIGVTDQTGMMLARLFANPIGQPTVAPFDLAAGVTVELEGTAMVPRDSMPGITTGEKQMFVPILSLNCEYSWNAEEGAGGDGQDAASFVVGLDKGQGAKLGAFRLNGVPRMWAEVKVMAYPVSRQR